MAKKKATRKASRGDSGPAKTSAARKKVAKKVVRKKPESKASGGSSRKPAAPAVVAAPAPVAPAPRKKGVRKATLTTGIRAKKPVRKLGRSRIPVDAPLDVVFQNDSQAREAFVFLGIHTIRELEAFHPDDLVMRLTSPAKQTVGRIRKILAMNNRCLEGDESFALELQERLSQSHMNLGH
ncbi:MAG: hypothetical protein JNL58_24635 [Planctomyces sp.]|nr:hypothetical protein [Planctomyces sp.]